MRDLDDGLTLGPMTAVAVAVNVHDHVNVNAACDRYGQPCSFAQTHSPFEQRQFVGHGL